MGVDPSRSLTYQATPVGTHSLYASLSASLLRSRGGGDLAFTDDDRTIQGVATPAGR